jgi:hypothetical protein
MKPSHLAALVLASIGVGGMSSAAISSPVVAGQHHPTQGKQQAVIQKSQTAMHFERMMLSAPVGIENHPCSWRKLNQRQIRKNQRRAHAAGKRNAFA